MDVWISGGFALVGALAGVLFSSRLTNSNKRKDARRARIEEALRRTSLTLAAANFATHVGATNAPASVTTENLEAFEARLFIANLERYYTALHDARHAVAMLIADGVDIGESWRLAEQFQDDLDALQRRLQSLLATS